MGAFLQEGEVLFFIILFIVSVILIFSNCTRKEKPLSFVWGAFFFVYASLGNYIFIETLFKVRRTCTEPDL
jgi:hypothetical protein